MTLVLNFEHVMFPVSRVRQAVRGPPVAKRYPHPPGA